MSTLKLGNCPPCNTVGTIMIQDGGQIKISKELNEETVKAVIKRVLSVNRIFFYCQPCCLMNQRYVTYRYAYRR